MVGCRALPTTGRVARAGRGREAGGVPRRDLLGTTDPRFRRSRRRGSSSSGWRRPPMAPTGPAGCSPATAAATGCSGRCTAPDSPTRPSRSSIDDGLELRDAWVTAAVKCAPPANKPTHGRARCLRTVPRARARGADGRDGGRVPRRVRLRGGVRAVRRAPPPAGSATASRSRFPADRTLLCSFHPSQQNTFTGRLTEPMLDAVFTPRRRPRDARASPPRSMRIRRERVA